MEKKPDRTLNPDPVGVDVGRLAMRKEGKYVNAYYAPEMTSMKESILLGSIRESTLIGGSASPLFQDFVELMKKAFEEFVLHGFGYRPTWSGQQPAPEHERSGSA